MSNVNIYWDGEKEMEVKWLNPDKTYVIAELGANHCGDINTAIKMVEEAAKAGVDCIKIQKRDMDSLNEYSDNKIYDNPNSFGKTYTEHRKALELSMEEIKQVLGKTKELGLDFSASCWDKKSIDDMEPYIDFYKLQSADSNNTELINYLLTKNKPVVMSVGGTDFESVNNTVLKFAKQAIPLGILHCTAIYPLSFDKVNLNNLETLQDLFPYNPIGYSGHEKGIAISTAAVALGARIIERHFTLDRSMKGGDQAASLEPQGLKKLVRDIRNVEDALGSFDKVLYDEEQEKLSSLNKTRKVFNWK